MAFQIHNTSNTFEGVAKLLKTSDREDSTGSNFYEAIHKNKKVNHRISRVIIPQLFTGGLMELESPLEETAGRHYLARVNSKLESKDPLLNRSLNLNQISKSGEEVYYPGQFTIYGILGLYVIGRGDR